VRKILSGLIVFIMVFILTFQLVYAEKVDGEEITSNELQTYPAEVETVTSATYSELPTKDYIVRFISQEAMEQSKSKAGIQNEDQLSSFNLLNETDAEGPKILYTENEFLNPSQAVMALTEEEYLSLQTNSDVVFIERDASVHIASEGEILQEHNKIATMKNDSEAIPWGIHSIGAYLAQEYSTDGKSVRIAVLDTGISKHSDLQVMGGVSFVEETSSYSDDHGHGTHVAGTIGALSNQIGVIGAAPGSEIYSVKVLDKQGQGTYSQVIKGIEWAIEHDMQIISMSFGGTEYSQALEDAIKVAANRGILVVAAAGNRGAGEEMELYPARYDEVISVGAVNNAHQITNYSSTGSGIDLVAPGSEILSTTADGNYGVASGTSMATAHVTASAALLWSNHTDWSDIEIKNQLYNTATPLGDAHEYGQGLVNVAKALDLINGPIAPTSERVDSDGSVIPIDETGDGVSIASYDKTGNFQSIRAGNSARVSLKLDGDLSGNNPHSRINVSVYPLNNSSNIIASRTIYNPSLDTSLSYTWYTSTSTPAGTYVIRYHYPAAPDYDDYFYIFVTQPAPPPITDTYEPNDSRSSATSASTGRSYISYISSSSDEDYFKFTAGTTGTMSAQLYVPSNKDYDFYIYPANSSSHIAAGRKGAGQTENEEFSVTANTVYYIKVIGFGGAYSSSRYTLNLGLINSVPAPAAPTGLTATAAADRITLRWNAVSGADYYKLQKNGAYANYNVSGTSYTFENLLPDTNYTLGVAAVSSAGGDSSYTTLNKRTLKADVEKPVVSVQVPDYNKPFVVDKKFKMEFSATDNVDVDKLELIIELNGKVLSFFPLDVTGATSFERFPSEPGTYRVTVRATDPSGNVGVASTSVEVDIKRDVVVFVPGFLGTEIKSGNGSTIWPTLNPFEVSNLALSTSGDPGDTYIGNIIEAFPCKVKTKFCEESTKNFLDSLEDSGVTVIRAP
jgi:subtilisin family serine protease